MRFLESHEWAKLEGDIAVCGISAYAAEKLGDVVFVELPEVGRAVAKGEAVAVVESAKAASDVYAPVSGEIVAVNSDLATSPERVNEAPEGAGWFLKIKTSAPAEFEALLDPAAYANLTK